MLRKPWRDWYHCIVGTYGQWLPGDPRGWHERHHHEHVPGTYKNPPKPTPFSQARHEHSKRIMNWSAYAIAPPDRPIVGQLLLQALRHHQIPALALAVCQNNFHALLQIHTHDPKRILGFAKCHVTFEFAPILDPATQKRQQIWEAGTLAKPIKDRAHALRTFRYILDHTHEAAWTWSFRNDPSYKKPPAPTTNQTTPPSETTPAICDGVG